MVLTVKLCILRYLMRFNGIFETSSVKLLKEIIETQFQKNIGHGSMIWTHTSSSEGFVRSTLSKSNVCGWFIYSLTVFGAEPKYKEI